MRNSKTQRQEVFCLPYLIYSEAQETTNEVVLDIKEHSIDNRMCYPFRQISCETHRLLVITHIEYIIGFLLSREFVPKTPHTANPVILFPCYFDKAKLHN